MSNPDKAQETADNDIINDELTNIQGECPKCGSDNLEYGCSKPYDNQIAYPYTCADCDFEGSERYCLSFIGHTDADGKDLV